MHNYLIVDIRSAARVGFTQHMLILILVTLHIWKVGFEHYKHNSSEAVL